MTTTTTPGPSRPLEATGVVILGGGGHARVVISVLRANDVTVAGFTDPNPNVRVGGALHLGDDEVLATLNRDVVMVVNGLGSIGSTSPRERVYERAVALGFRFHPLVHKSASVAADVVLGVGVQVMAGAIVQTGVSIASNVLINTGAVIDHDCTLESHCHIAPRTVLSGEVTVGRGAHIGTGATIRQGIRVGPGAIVGAGAVVVNDVPEGCTVVGVPARPLKETAFAS